MKKGEEKKCMIHYSNVIRFLRLLLTQDLFNWFNPKGTTGKLPQSVSCTYKYLQVVFNNKVNQMNHLHTCVDHLPAFYCVKVNLIHLKLHFVHFNIQIVKSYPVQGRLL